MPRIRSSLARTVGVLIFLLGATLISLLIPDDGRLAAKYLVGAVALGLSWQLVVSASSEAPSASIGLLMVAILTIYHCISEALAIAIPTPYRVIARVDQSDAVRAFLVASFGILALSLGYRVAARVNLPIRAVQCPEWLSRVSVPALLAYSAAARIYRGGGRILIGSSTALYWLDALLFYLELPILVVLALAVLRHTQLGLLPRWTPWALVPYAVTISFLAGTRLDLLVVVVSVLVLAKKWRILSPSPTTVLVLSGALLAFFAAIATIRGEIGRSTIQEAAPSERAAMTIDGLMMGTGASASDRESFIQDLGYRVDGNAFLGALPIVAFNLNTEPLITAAAISIPAYLYPQKKELCGNGVCNVEASIIRAEQLQDIDYLPTSLAVAVACFGAVGACIIAFGFGLALRLVEAWLVRPRAGLFSGVIAASLATTLAFGEGDVTMLALMPRNVIMLTVLFSTVFRGWNFIVRERFGRRRFDLEFPGGAGQVGGPAPARRVR